MHCQGFRISSPTLPPSVSQGLISTYLMQVGRPKACIRHHPQWHTAKLRPMDPAASATDSREPSKLSFDSPRCKGLPPCLCSHTPSRNALPDHLTLHILEVFSSPSIEAVPVSQHPWSNLEHRTFWTGRRPKRHWPKVFQRRPPPSLPSDAPMGKVSTPGAAAFAPKQKQTAYTNAACSRRR